ncbi:MAG: hypothetical protein JJU00_08135 [Opitutales bacterium]|nr:hypothetical protein [Opitutales bacterium]
MKLYATFRLGFAATAVCGLAAALVGAETSETVFAKSDPLWRPAHAPRATDVIMRSLRPRVDGDEHDSIKASKAFHVTRHEWTYLNYEMQGGSIEASDEFVRQARAEGILVGGAGSGSSHHVDRFTDMEVVDFCVRELDGSLYIMPHKRGWAFPAGQGSVFSDEYFRIHVAHYTEQLDIGARSLQRDEGWMAISHGYDFNPKAVAAFREYLADNSTAAERAEWGIGDPDRFDAAEYFRNLDPPVDSSPRWFRDWLPDDPVKQIYDQFIVDGVVNFYQRLRAALNDHAGRPVPFSCNNTSRQQWTPAHLQFDWAMSELMFQTANAEHLYDRYRAGLGHGKVQVISTPKPIGEVDDHEAFRELNRKVIAQAYALGGLCKAPWDLFLQTVDGRGRYFGEAADYADLYGFVRAMAPYMEDFEEAAAYGEGIPDAHGWETHPLRVEGSDEVYAFLRVRPRDTGSPVVIHVVNWGGADEEADILVRAAAVQWAEDNMIARLLRPAPYDERLHRLADRHQADLLPHNALRGPDQHPAYQKLVESTVLDHEETADGWLRFRGIAADPWSVIVLEKL